MLRVIICLVATLLVNFSFSYTQSDLLNAQTNFQTAKSNLDTNKINYSNAQNDVKLAESELQQAQKKLADAQKKLKTKQESAVIAKHNLDTANNVYNQSGTTVDSIWNQMNGKANPQNSATN